jgi:hypothetical protein
LKASWIWQCNSDRTAARLAPGNKDTTSIRFADHILNRRKSQMKIRKTSVAIRTCVRAATSVDAEPCSVRRHDGDEDYPFFLSAPYSKFSCFTQRGKSFAKLYRLKQRIYQAQVSSTPALHLLRILKTSKKVPLRSRNCEKQQLEPENNLIP